MLEEKNDNLSNEHNETDGKLESVLQEPQVFEIEDTTSSSEANAFQTVATETVEIPTSEEADEEIVVTQDEEIGNPSEETHAEIEEVAAETTIHEEAITSVKENLSAVLTERSQPAASGTW